VRRLETAAGEWCLHLSACPRRRDKSEPQNDTQNDTQSESQNDTQKHDPLAEKIIAAMRANPEATRADIAKQAGVSLATIARKLKEMNCIRYVGSSKKGHWEVDD